MSGLKSKRSYEYAVNEWDAEDYISDRDNVSRTPMPKPVAKEEKKKEPVAKEKKKKTAEKKVSQSAVCGCMCVRCVCVR